MAPNRQLVSKSCAELKGQYVWPKLLPHCLAQRQWDTNAWVSNNPKSQSELAWQPRYSFESGFRQMVNWLKDNPRLEEEDDESTIR